MAEWVALGASYTVLADTDRQTHESYAISDTPELVVIRDDGTIVYRGSNSGGHYQAEQVVLALLGL
jgi:hypothetical protein